MNFITIMYYFYTAFLSLRVINVSSIWDNNTKTLYLDEEGKGWRKCEIFIDLATHFFMCKLHFQKNYESHVHSKILPCVTFSLRLMFVVFCSSINTRSMSKTGGGGVTLRVGLKVKRWSYANKNQIISR